MKKRMICCTSILKVRAEILQEDFSLIFLQQKNFYRTSIISFTDFLQFAQNERRKQSRPSSRAYPTIVCAFCLHAFTR